MAVQKCVYLFNPRKDTLTRSVNVLTIIYVTQTQTLPRWILQSTPEIQYKHYARRIKGFIVLHALLPLLHTSHLLSLLVLSTGCRGLLDLDSPSAAEPVPG